MDVKRRFASSEKKYISEFEDIAIETIPCEHRKKNRSDLNYWE